MEKVTINTAVNVRGGPLVKLTAQVESDAYVVASLALAAGVTGNATILPNPGGAVLLVISAQKDKDQAVAKVEVTPSGTKAGTKFNVNGSLLVANADVVGGLAEGGPQKLAVKNLETEDVTVSILAAFDS